MNRHTFAACFEFAFALVMFGACALWLYALPSIEAPAPFTQAGAEAFALGMATFHLIIGAAFAFLSLRVRA